jgi:ABC-type Fe3+-hydroxamate transport system substrate-binding protein
MLAQLDYRRARAAAKRIFAERATHTFPPSAALPAEWQRELETLAQELGYRTTKAEEIEAEFAAVLRAIATA